ncbi:hypothetical protein BDF14DRAFT_1754758 [Spinellus fusiger]|nr:hypothetical protein BDF14DRAFT_1754758 [Spinellus fusiger]
MYLHSVLVFCTCIHIMYSYYVFIVYNCIYNATSGVSTEKKQGEGEERGRERGEIQERGKEIYLMSCCAMVCDDVLWCTIHNGIEI